MTMCQKERSPTFTCGAGDDFLHNSVATGKRLRGLNPYAAVSLLLPLEARVSGTCAKKPSSIVDQS